MEQFKRFWLLVVEVWEKGVAGIDLGRIITAALILVGFLLIRRLFTRFVIRRISRLARRTRTTIDDEAVELLERPKRSFLPTERKIQTKNLPPKTRTRPQKSAGSKMTVSAGKVDRIVVFSVHSRWALEALRSQRERFFWR